MGGSDGKARSLWEGLMARPGPRGGSDATLPRPGPWGRV